jgi:hypothetical protein
VSVKSFMARAQMRIPGVGTKVCDSSKSTLSTSDLGEYQIDKKIKIKNKKNACLMGSVAMW